MSGSRFVHVQIGDRVSHAIRERAAATGATVREVVFAALKADLQLEDEACRGLTPS